MDYTVLIVDDEELMRDIMKISFKSNGFKVLQAADGEEAMEVFLEKENEIDLIILDVMMPKIDGWSVCRRIRQMSNVTIIMLTARDDDSDQLMGYQLGVDDYITKPINTNILIAKSTRLLERINTARNERDIIEIGGIVIDKEAYSVQVDGENIDFAHKEYDLLLYLMNNKNAVMTREKILDHVWGYDYYGDSRVVDTHIKKIRKKLGNKSELIQTVVRVGYKFSE